MTIRRMPMEVTVPILGHHHRLPERRQRRKKAGGDLVDTIIDTYNAHGGAGRREVPTAVRRPVTAGDGGQGGYAIQGANHSQQFQGNAGRWERDWLRRQWRQQLAPAAGSMALILEASNNFAAGAGGRGGDSTGGAPSGAGTGGLGWYRWCRWKYVREAVVPVARWCRRRRKQRQQR